MEKSAAVTYKFYIEIGEGDLIYRGDRWQVCRGGRLKNTAPPKLFTFSFLAPLRALLGRLGHQVGSKNCETPTLLCSNVRRGERQKLPHLLQCEEHSSIHKFLIQHLHPPKIF